MNLGTCYKKHSYCNTFGTGSQIAGDHWPRCLTLWKSVLQWKVLGLGLQLWPCVPARQAEQCPVVPIDTWPEGSAPSQVWCGTEIAFHLLYPPLRTNKLQAWGHQVLQYCFCYWDKLPPKMYNCFLFYLMVLGCREAICVAFFFGGEGGRKMAGGSYFWCHQVSLPCFYRRKHKGDACG